MNECGLSNGGCAQICTNKAGDFVCSCRDGFLLGEDQEACHDINECEDEPCSHTCVNLYGSYRCECPPGGYLFENGTTCIGITLINLNLDKNLFFTPLIFLC